MKTNICAFSIRERDVHTSVSNHRAKHDKHSFKLNLTRLDVSNETLHFQKMFQFKPYAHLTVTPLTENALKNDAVWLFQHGHYFTPKPHNVILYKYFPLMASRIMCLWFKTLN